MAMQVNQSVIVTSSRFTKDARAFAEERQNLMALWDIDDLLKLTMIFGEPRGIKIWETFLILVV